MANGMAFTRANRHHFTRARHPTKQIAVLAKYPLTHSAMCGMIQSSKRRKGPTNDQINQHQIRDGDSIPDIWARRLPLGDADDAGSDNAVSVGKSRPASRRRRDPRGHVADQ